MNVAQVSHLYRPSIGGIENYSHRLVGSLERSGHQVSVVTTDESLENEDSPLEADPAVRYCKTTGSLLRNPFSIELFSTVRDIDADVCHLHSPWYLSSLEAATALPEDAPLVMTIHGFQPIQSLAAKLLGTAYRPFAQYVFDRVDRTIVLGEAERERLLDEYDVSPGDVTVIPNGIRPDSFDVDPSEVDRIRSSHGLDPATPTVLFISRLVPLKNPDILVEAVAEQLPDRDLDVVMVGNGSDDYVADLRERADERFHFRANLPFQDVKALYHASDLFVLPSEMEGLPTVVLEAMNGRLPVITTPVGALADVVDHREHGWVLDDAPDPRSVAAAIEHYVEDPDERRAVGRRNREYVRESFDWADVAAEIESVYEQVTRRSTRSSRPGGRAARPGP